MLTYRIAQHKIVLIFLGSIIIVTIEEPFRVCFSSDVSLLTQISWPYL